MFHYAKVAVSGGRREGFFHMYFALLSSESYYYYYYDYNNYYYYYVHSLAFPKGSESAEDHFSSLLSPPLYWTVRTIQPVVAKGC